MIELPELSGWAIALIALLPITLWSIIGLVRKIVFLERRLESSIVLSDLKIFESGEAGSNIYRLRLIAMNRSGEQLSKCLVKLTSISPITTDMNMAEFPIALRTMAQIEQARKGRFELSPGEEKHLELITFSSGEPKSPAIIHTELWSKHLLRDTEYEITVVAHCERGLPDKKTMKITANEADGLMLYECR